MAITPLHDDIPTDRAWRTGRRVYVRCGYQSQLNTELRDLGGRWDADERALWVGSGKADKVIPLVAAAIERAAAIETVKATATETGRWVTIPYAAAAVRDRAKALGARWDAGRKQWAMPTDTAHAEISEAVAALHAAAAAERAAERAARGATVEAAKPTPADIVAGAGRVATGDTAHTLRLSTRRMNKAVAATMAHKVGAVVHLTDGRRGVVVDTDVWFTGEEMASSACWHDETHDQAHWDIRATLAVVEPTDAERAADQAAAEQAGELVELDAVFVAAAKGDLTDGHTSERWTTVAGPRITRRGGSTGSVDHGRIILGEDGVVWWQHPGYCDDYRRSERRTTDPALYARVRALTALGARTAGDFTIEETR